MPDKNLSKEEIDILFKNADSVTEGALELAEPIHETSHLISQHQMESLRHLVRECMHQGILKINGILSQKIKLLGSQAKLVPQGTLNQEFSQKTILFMQELNGAVQGQFFLVFPVEAARLFISMLMEKNKNAKTDKDLDPAEMAILNETVEPLISGIIESLGQKIRNTLTREGQLKIYTMGKDMSPITEANYLKISIPFRKDKQKDKQLEVLITLNMAQQIYNAEQTKTELYPMEETATVEEEEIGSGPFSVKEVGFPSFQEKTIGEQKDMTPNTNLLMDVQMMLTVELGRTKMFIKEILSLGEGSIIELDKLAGEPVDLLVNGKLVAKGEVVVIDENFGVRVTDVVSPSERAKLQLKEEA